MFELQMTETAASDVILASEGNFACSFLPMRVERLLLRLRLWFVVWVDIDTVFLKKVLIQHFCTMHPLVSCIEFHLKICASL